MAAPLEGLRVLDISEGIAPGTFITVERSNPRNSLNVGPDGDGTNVTNNDRSGTMTITLRKGSDINTLLSEKMIASEVEGGTPAAAPS